MDGVSIIIPVCNGEKYLRRCIESISGQTYSNISLIIFNDGSTDSSWNLLKKLKSEYEKKDSIKNMYIHNQRNQGVAVTRNNGLKIIRDNYVMFIDQDDYIEKDYVEIFVDAIKKYNVDIVIGGYKRPEKSGKIKKNVVYKDLEWCKFMNITPWSKIYSTRFLQNNNIEFLNSKIGEDIYFNIMAYVKTAKIKIIQYSGYNWYINNNSVSNTVHRKIRLKEDTMPMLNEIYSIVEKNDKVESEYYKYFFAKFIIWQLLYTYKDERYENIDDKCDILFGWLEKHFKSCYKNISFFNPRGESFWVRLIVKILCIMRKIHMEKFAIKALSRIT